MSQRLLRLLLPEDGPLSSYRSTDGAREFGPLSQINLVVGPNNSGKSRFLRLLFLGQALPYASSLADPAAIRDLAAALTSEASGIFSGIVTAVGSLTPRVFEPFSNAPDFVTPDRSPHAELRECLGSIASSASKITRRAMTTGSDSPQIEAAVKELARTGLERLDGIPWDTSVESVKRFYVPILRGMRPFDDSHTDQYEARTRSDYFTSGEASLIEGRHFVFTGLTLYKSLKEKLLGEPEDRQAVADYERYLADTFFDGIPVTLIPREGANTVHVKIGPERQLPIFALGDGLQSLIVLTFNMFLEQSPALFFFEEPDTHMHPGLQRSLLDAMLRLDRHQFFLTTHSNHLLDLTLDSSDISVVRVTKSVAENEPSFEVNCVPPASTAVLRDLGVLSSSVFHANATLWVEGHTDRLYLRAYMKRYVAELRAENSERGERIAHLREDIHYAFVEYQGSNLPHWAFEEGVASDDAISAVSVCSPALVIADGDINHERGRHYESVLKDRFVQIEGKEIENLIPAEIVQSLVSERFERAGVQLSRVRYDDYSKSAVGLGAYLDGLLDLGESEAGFGTRTGTIKGKGNWCRRAVALMEEIEWSLTPELRSLCARIFDHILHANSLD